MITSYAMLQPVQAPQGSQEWLLQLLADSGATEYTVTLMSVTTNGYLFSVAAEETDDNADILTSLFGSVNTIVPEVEQQAMARGVEMFNPAGNWNGRFAQENPSPANARYPK